MISDAEIAQRIEAVEADITTLKLDAIVNAANEPLYPGGGVDGAIRRAAGEEMNEELSRIGRCLSGTSVVTFGYRLPASYVIHTVAPLWSGHEGDIDEEHLFSRCYSSALELADKKNIRSMAFPAIGTGAYHWPAQLAAKIAFQTVVTHLRGGGLQTRIVFCCFARSDLERYAALISSLAAS